PTRLNSRTPQGVQVMATRSPLIAQGALLPTPTGSRAVPGRWRTSPHHRRRTTPRSRQSPRAPLLPRPARGGMTMTGVVRPATVPATRLAAGVTLRVAEMLGAPTVVASQGDAEDRRGHPLAQPVPPRRPELPVRT